MLVFSALCLSSCDFEDLYSKNEKKETSSEVVFKGKVLDEITGKPLELTEVSTNPITITVVTNSSGEYTINQSLQADKNYTINFAKYGYLEKQITQLARVGYNEVGQSLMERDTTTFTFINVLIRDNDNNLVAGAVVTYAGVGKSYTGTTDATGIFSMPIPKTSTTQTFSIKAPGFKDVSGTYNVYSGTCTNVVNGTTTAQSGAVIVQLQPSI